jgi:hypothetical protein
MQGLTNYFDAILIPQDHNEEEDIEEESGV